MYKQSATTAGGEIHGTTVPWPSVTDLYGTVVNGITQIRLTFDYPDGPHEIVGTVAYNPVNDTQLLFTPFPETLPANTLTAVNAIIDPRNVTVDTSILNPPSGTRYLILNSIGTNDSASPAAWIGTDSNNNLVANTNDIIEYDGQKWTVSFDSRELAVQYVSNIKTTIQYRWTGESWVKSYEGLYAAGNWSLVL